MNRQIAAWITHRWVKWVALIVMIAICGGLGSLAAKLTSVQDNKVENWLPSSAESTKLIKQAGKFYDAETMPGVVIYERKSGIRPADIDAVKADMTRLAGISGIRPGIAGPILSKDGRLLGILEAHGDHLLTERQAIGGLQGMVENQLVKNGQEGDRLVGAAHRAELRELIERHVTAVAQPPGVSG